MKFVYPDFLFALLALAIPILIHLFNFKKFKRIEFSNVAFLQDHLAVRAKAITTNPPSVSRTDSSWDSSYRNFSKKAIAAKEAGDKIAPAWRDLRGMLVKQLNNAHEVSPKVVIHEE